MLVAAFVSPFTVVPEGKFSISIQGSSFVDGTGNPFIPRGISIGWPERKRAMPFTIAQLQSWNVKMVRIIMDEDCYLSINNAPSCWNGTGPWGTGYRTQIINFVNACAAANIYVVLTLTDVGAGTNIPRINGNPLPDRDHAPTLWTTVAGDFKSLRNVVFNPFNEPNGFVDNTASWTLWRDGDTGNNKSCIDITYSTSYACAGMQELVTAIRNAGATKQPIILDGWNYASWFTQWETYAPNDPSNLLAGSAHFYDVATSSVQSAIQPLLTAGTPVLVTELGELDCAHTYIDQAGPFLNSLKVGQLYWAWNWPSFPCASSPNLISDTTGPTPTAYGVGVKSYLLSFP